MLKKLTKILVAVAMAFVMAGVTQAAAEPKLEEARFFGSPDNAPEVKVGAEDGKWVILKSPGITYKFNYYVKANRKLRFIYVSNMNVPAENGTAPWVRGDISGDGKQRTAWGDGSFFLPNGRIGNDSGKVKAACNDLISQGKTTTSEGGETYATLDLTARVAVGDYGGGTQFGRLSGTTMVKVICEPEPSKIQAPPKPFSVDVQVEQKGETCPKQTDVTAIIKYKVPATARFRFKVDGKLSKLYEIKARKVEPYKPQPVPGGGGYYLVKRLKTYHLDPGQTHFRVVMEDGSGKKSAVKTVKIDCPPFEVMSAWLKYKVAETPTCPKEVREEATFHATRPGWVNYQIKHQGGLVVSEGKVKAKRQGMQYVATAKRTLTMNKFDGEFMAEVVDGSANSGWVPLKVDCLELKGDFSFLDNGGTRCPREGKALINFSMNVPANIHWSLDCNIGHFSGVAQAVSDNKGGYVAPALAKFDIKKTKQVNCALKSVSPIKRAHALKGHLFQCVTPSGVTGSNDLKPETRPNPDAPRVPGKVVIDPPREPKRPGLVVIDPPRTPSDSVPPTYPVPPGGRGGRAADALVVDTGKGGGASDATPDYPKKTRADAEADKKRLEALKRKQALEARKKAEAEARRKREAAKKTAEARRKREAAKKAAELKRKREAAKKAAEARRKREAAKKAAQQAAKRKRKASKKRRKRKINTIKLR